VFLYLGEVGGRQYAISALGSDYFDAPQTSDPIDANSVNVNTLDVVRKNGKSWLANLTQAKSFADDGSFRSYAVPLDPTWKYADFSKISTGAATLYRARTNRRDILIAVNAGHGTKGGSRIKTYSHPDKSPKLTGGTSPLGAIESIAVSGGMQFADGTGEAEVTLRTARIVRTELLRNGFDVLLLRDGDDVQLDNIARTVISNNTAAIHIALHYDGDREKDDKGCFYCVIPEALHSLKTVKKQWQESERLGQCLIDGLRAQGVPIYGDGTFEQDLTQTSFSTIPTAVVELGNQHTKTDTESLEKRAKGIAAGVMQFFAE
ncbi:MAG: N-acetylmuramoyl-L-alanine amidase, partial [Treponemataceae bacterium]|nr:N-acetylmuramoyl-L-alanine amidase [Treponemataceae bacterium]